MSKDVRGYTNGPWKKVNVDLSNNKIHQVIGPVVCKNQISVKDANLLAELATLLEALEEMLADYKDAAIDFDAYNQEVADEIILRAEQVIARALGEGG